MKKESPKKTASAPGTWLNYHHLFYFWTVAREGGITAASRRLRLAQPTISGQLKTFEEAMGVRLFDRVGRGLVLTESGRLVYEYADEIFSIGRELLDVLRGAPAGRPARLVVGVSDVLPKLVAFRLIEPALRLPEQIRVTCVEGRTDRLVAELALHEIDLVLADAPLTGRTRVRAYNHQLGESAVSFFATPDLARRARRGFPRSLESLPMLLPSEHTTIRGALEEWFERVGIRPEVHAEFDDSALMKVFGQAGVGVFCAPSVVEKEVCRQYGVRAIGQTDEVRERFYAISIERRISNPAVAAIRERAREILATRDG